MTTRLILRARGSDGTNCGVQRDDRSGGVRANGAVGHSLRAMSDSVDFSGIGDRSGHDNRRSGSNGRRVPPCTGTFDSGQSRRSRESVSVAVTVSLRVFGVFGVMGRVSQVSRSSTRLRSRLGSALGRLRGKMSRAVGRVVSSRGSKMRGCRRWRGIDTSRKSRIVGRSIEQSNLFFAATSQARKNPSPSFVPLGKLS